jgi:serine O-acetyltransferase
VENLEQKIECLVDSILADYAKGREIDKMEQVRRPDKAAVIELIDKLRWIVFPGYNKDKNYKVYNAKHNLSMLIEDVFYNLNKQIALAYQWAGEQEDTAAARAQEVSLQFFEKIPAVRAVVQTDLAAFYEGDPAATDVSEIIFAYPGLFAITVYRLAHELHLQKVPLLPRIMTEHAHSVTGIDIHPGATVGEYFFIDHGTGIVIGETAVIGNNVKLYQGVTLGALSTRGGQSLRGKRRHPTIEDNVTIYAGASVLGGETVIGRGCVIGSNAFITKSVAPCTTVSIKNQELQVKVRPGCCEEFEK